MCRWCMPHKIIIDGVYEEQDLHDVFTKVYSTLTSNGYSYYKILISEITKQEYIDEQRKKDKS
jgi:hypothetical protein